MEGRQGGRRQGAREEGRKGGREGGGRGGRKGGRGEEGRGGEEGWKLRRVLAKYNISDICEWRGAEAPINFPVNSTKIDPEKIRFSKPENPCPGRGLEGDEGQI